MINQITSTKNYLNNYDENKVYSYNIQDFNFNNLDEKIIKSTSCYKFEYRYIENKISLVLLINENALSTGIPIFMDNNLFFCELSKGQIVEGKIYSHNKNLLNENIGFLNYIDEEQLRENIFLNELRNAEYLILEKNELLDLNNASILVFEKNEAFYKYYDFNLFNTNSFLVEGNILKSHNNSSYLFLIIISYVLLLIPLISAIFIFYNFYTFFLNRQKKLILIEFIYGQSLQKSLYENRLEILIVSFSPMIISAIIAYIITFNSILYCIVGCLCGFVFSFILARIITKKSIKKIFYSDSWSIKND